MLLDLRLDNANVVTMDPARPRARSVGILGGRVVGLTDDRADELAGVPAARVIDLAGATVLPGFIDAHTHLEWAGIASRSLDVHGVDDRGRLLDTIGRAAAAAAPGAWVDVVGYDQRPLGGHLTAGELDRVAAGRQLLVQHVSGHVCVVNTAVLDQLPLAGPAGRDPGVHRDAAGSPSGLLEERAQLLARERRLPYALDELVEAIERAGQACLAQGITMCADAGIGAGIASFSPVDLTAFQLARESGRLPVRVELMPAADAMHPVAAHPADGIRTGLDLGLRTGFGDDWLSIGAQKVWLDGGMIARTAAMTAPYLGTDTAGDLQLDAERLIGIVVDGHAAGWQMALHAIGDRAVDVAIEAFERAQARHPRADARPRIEHCGAVRPDQIDRLSALGVLAVIQPTFLIDNGDDYAAILGPERAGWLYRGRGLTERGVRVVGSSDRPVTDGAPLRAMRCMVDRRTAGGQVIGADEAMTVDEALAAYTVDAAYALRRERVMGTIASGKYADLVVLADDPRTVDAARIGDVDVVATVVDGEIAYGAAALA